MKITFFNPPFRLKFSREQRSPAVTKSGTFYYPMWLAYAAGWSQANGHQIDLIDATANKGSQSGYMERLLEFQPRLIVMTTSTPSVFSDFQVAENLKKAMPDARIAAAGPHVSALPEWTLDKCAAVDFVLRAEYEETALELANALERNESPEEITGLTMRTSDGIKSNPPRIYVRDLDKFPFVSTVYKQFLRIEDYFYSIAPHPIVTIVSGRGCPHQCAYCVYPQTMMGAKYRFREPEAVVEECLYIQHELPQSNQIFFEDDTLAVNKKRCLELCDLMAKKGLKLTWTANSRADIDLETLKAMKRGGCRLLCVGFESGEQSVLNRVGKHLSLEQSEIFRRNAAEAGILVHGCFMVGNPGDTKETLRKTLDLAKKLNPDSAQFFPIMVYPGTKAYDWAKTEGYLETEDFSQWTTEEGLHNCVVSTDYMSSRELVEFCDEARREFYLRPAYVAKKLYQGLTDWREFKRNAKAALTLKKYIFRGSFRKNPKKSKPE